MNKKVNRISEIKIKVGLNSDNIPVEIGWEASDDQQAGNSRPCKAMFMSFFEKDNKNSAVMDLWTQDFEMGEMDFFVFQTMQRLTDAYYRGTKNAQLANQMQEFVRHFGKSTNILPKDS